VALGFCLWNGFWAPKGTPQEVISKLNAAVVNILAGPELRRRLIGLAYEIPPPRASDPGGIGRAAKGRNREMVTHHQGRDNVKAE